MRQLTVLIRADASETIGFGHLSRCLALATQLRDRGARVVFATRGLFASNLVKQRGFETRLIAVSGVAADHCVPREDVEMTLRLAADLGADRLVVDHYGYRNLDIACLAGGGLPVTLFDDVGTRHGEGCALIVNPSPGVPEGTYQVDSGAAMLGPRFASLHPVWAARRRQGRATQNAPLRRVLVALGGADTSRSTMDVLERLDAELAPDVQIDAVFGPLVSCCERLRSERVHQQNALTSERLAQAMLDAQIVIATPSTIAWEVATLGRASILLQVADNQRWNTRGLIEAGAARLAFTADEVTGAFSGPSGLADDSTRVRVASAAAELTDGQGASRIAGRLLAPSSTKGSVCAS